MSTSNQNCTEEGDGGQESSLLMSRKLDDLMDLMNTMHAHLEECAIHWQSKISQQQWNMLNEDITTRQSRSRSIFSRTYFRNSDLDDAFEKLLQCEDIFRKQIHGFVEMLRDKLTGITVVSDIKSIENIENPSTSSISDQSKPPQPTQSTLSTTMGSFGEPSDKPIGLIVNNNLKDHFKSLMEAKLNFDSKFFSFNAELHGDVHSHLQSPKCTCKICTNDMGATRRNPPRQKMLRTYPKPAVKRSLRKRQKKGAKRKDQNLSVSGQMGDGMRQTGHQS